MFTVQPRRKQLRLTTVNYSADHNQVYFVTIRASTGDPFLDPGLAQDLVALLRHQRSAGRLRVFAYAMMPNHTHLVISVPRSGDCLANVVKDFKSYSTRQSWQRGCVGPLWQRGYYEHICRDAGDALTKCNYVLGNPVRAGLAKAMGEWPYAGSMDEPPI